MEPRNERQVFSFSTKGSISWIRFLIAPTFLQIQRAISYAEAHHATALRAYSFTGGLDLPTKDLRRLLAFAEGKLDFGYVAIVVSQDLGFGLSRMYESMRNINEKATWRVCHSEEEAETWLLATPDSQ